MAQNTSFARHEFTEVTPVAVVVDGVSKSWDQNVVQVMAAPGCVHVAVAGHGVVTASALRLSRDQARRLAAEIAQLLSTESDP